MSKRKHRKAAPVSHTHYVHAKGCYTLERLFKKQMVEAVSRRIVDGHAMFTLHESFNPKHKIENQHGGRWKLTERDEVVRAIELAKRKKIALVEERG